MPRSLRLRATVAGIALLVGAALVPTVIAGVSLAFSALPTPVGGGGGVWTAPVVSTPCHSENGSGVCFVWSTQAQAKTGPWELRLTDSTVVPPAPSGDTVVPPSNVTIRLGSSWTSIPIDGQITVALTSPGPYGITEILEETLCSPSGCGQSITSYAYSTITTG